MIQICVGLNCTGDMMKSNTGLLKNSLHQALINAPDDFSLQEVKILIVRALDIVESVEKKRNIRETSVQKRKEASVAQKKEFFNSLKAIENEIASAKNNLNEIKNKKMNKQNQKPSDFESDEMQNVFG